MLWCTMTDPLVSVSGVRGTTVATTPIERPTFTDDLVRRWTAAFARWCAARGAGGTVVLARDTRPSGLWAATTAADVLVACGVRPIVIGVTPTPTAQLAVTHHRATGGLVITGSHNPAEWNALKFLGPDGVFLNSGDIEKLRQIVIASPSLPLGVSGVKELPRAATDGLPGPTGPRNDAWEKDDDAIARHIGNVLSLPIDIGRIRARKFRVVVDPINGAGTLAVPQLLERLGCTVTVINGEANGAFTHPPEPTPAHLGQLGEAVQTARADLGIAVDPDADRLVLADETGAVLSEEYTVTLAILSVFSTHGGSAIGGALPPCVVVNLSTTRMVDDVAARFGARVVRTPVGERHVVEGMRAHAALIGGEGNGGVIYPASHEGRDSLVGSAVILHLLARGTTLSKLVAELPVYAMRKEKLPRTETWDAAHAAEALAHALPDGILSTLDGVRVDTAEGWIHLRPSNTEPIVRLISEAHTAAALERLFLKTRAALASISAS